MQLFITGGSIVLMFGMMIPGVAGKLLTGPYVVFDRQVGTTHLLAHRLVLVILVLLVVIAPLLVPQAEGTVLCL